jgi:hypothetical protein
MKINKEANIQISKYPSPHYEKFFEKFAEIDTVEIKDWNITHLIAYFVRRYKEYYNADYTFRFNSTAPGKSYEVYNFNKLAHQISANPTILKDYIDWWFCNKIIIKKKKLTSLAFLTEANIINEYKESKLLMGKKSISRSTFIPPNFMDVIRRYDHDIETYGDLAFVKRCISTNDYEQKHIEMMQELNKIGMDISSLDRVK